MLYEILEHKNRFTLGRHIGEDRVVDVESERTAGAPHKRKARCQLSSAVVYVCSLALIKPRYGMLEVYKTDRDQPVHRTCLADSFRS